MVTRHHACWPWLVLCLWAVGVSALDQLIRNSEFQEGASEWSVYPPNSPAFITVGRDHTVQLFVPPSYQEAAAPGVVQSPITVEPYSEYCLRVIAYQVGGSGWGKPALRAWVGDFSQLQASYTDFPKGVIGPSADGLVFSPTATHEATRLSEPLSLRPTLPVNYFVVGGSGAVPAKTFYPYADLAFSFNTAGVGAVAVGVFIDATELVPRNASQGTWRLSQKNATFTVDAVRLTPGTCESIPDRCVHGFTTPYWHEVPNQMAPRGDHCGVGWEVNNTAYMSIGLGGIALGQANLSPTAFVYKVTPSAIVTVPPIVSQLPGYPVIGTHLKFAFGCTAVPREGRHPLIVHLAGKYDTPTGADSFSIMVLDPETRSFVSRGNTAVARFGGGAAYYRGLIFLVGGSDPRIEVINTTTWAVSYYFTPLPPPYAGLYGFDAITLDDHIYLVGGHGVAGTGRPASTLVRFHPPSGEFLPRADMLARRLWVSTALYQGYIWVTGGADAGIMAPTKSPNIVECYSTLEDKWRSFGPVPDTLWRMNNQMFGLGRYLFTTSPGFTFPVVGQLTQSLHGVTTMNKTCGAGVSAVNGSRACACDDDVHTTNCSALHDCFYPQGVCSPNNTCTCATGWTGVDCAVDVNECAGQPCQHGGGCTDLVGSYWCTCVGSYAGRDCSIDIPFIAWMYPTSIPSATGIVVHVHGANLASSSKDVQLYLSGVALELLPGAALLSVNSTDILFFAPPNPGWDNSLRALTLTRGYPFYTGTSCPGPNPRACSSQWDQLFYTTTDCQRMPANWEVFGKACYFYGAPPNCVRCVDCGFCPGGAVSWPRPGCWRDPRETASLNPIGSCAYPAEERCLGGALSGCGVGYEDRYCALCSSGYYEEEDGSCESCTNASSTALMLFAVVTAVAIFVGIYWSILVGSDETLDKWTPRLTAAQQCIVAGLAASSLAPPYMQATFNYLKLLTFDFSFIRPGCLIGGVHYTTLYFISIGFLAVFGVVGLLCAFGYQYWQASHPSPEHRRTTVTQQAHETFHWLWNSRYPRARRAVNIIFHITFVELCKRTLTVLYCSDLNGEYLLVVEPSEICYQGSHLPAAIVAWSVLFGYIIGMPLMFLWIVHGYPQMEMWQEQLKMNAALAGGPSSPSSSSAPAAAVALTSMGSSSSSGHASRSHRTPDVGRGGGSAAEDTEEDGTSEEWTANPAVAERERQATEYDDVDRHRPELVTKSSSASGVPSAESRIQHQLKMFARRWGFLYNGLRPEWWWFRISGYLISLLVVVGVVFIRQAVYAPLVFAFLLFLIQLGLTLSYPMLSHKQNIVQISLVLVKLVGVVVSLLFAQSWIAAGLCAAVTVVGLGVSYVRVARTPKDGDP